MEIVQFIIAFNLGLFSTLHCVGMCGGIISALSISIPENNGFRKISRIKFVWLYNFGRITSYIIAGTIVGLIGENAINSFIPTSGHKILQVAATVVLILIGLHISGWLPFMKKIEYAGMKFWQLIQPMSKHFIPVTTLPKALMVGALWGWLPCALVYSVLLWSATSGSAVKGALYMLFFGLGTLPSMVMTGIAGDKLFNVLRRQTLRATAGAIIILLGLASLYLYPGFHNHHETHYTGL